jgi:hypothetical protein
MLDRVRGVRQNYAGRGVTCDPRWLDFVNFLADMGSRPAGKTLDRKNNDGNYTKKNCKWSTPKEQRANTRPSEPYSNTGVKGVYETNTTTKPYRVLARWHGERYSAGCYTTLEEALVIAQQALTHKIKCSFHPYGSSGFKGVYNVGRKKNPYLALAYWHGRKYSVGRYTTAQEASAAYQRKMKELRG